MTKIVGHRGVAGYAPENTLRAFEYAIELGCDRTELDVHLSKDGEVIVIHDDNVSRVTDGTGKVADLSLAELKRLRCPEGQEIPTLQEVINITKGKIGLQIELKAKGTPEPVCSLLRKNEIEEDTLVISFRAKLLRKIKQLNSKLQVGLLFHSAPSKLWDLVEDIPCDAIAPKHSAVTSELVDKAHRLGKRVFAYGVNEKDVFERLSALGVDEIGTDFPKLFIVR